MRLNTFWSGMILGIGAFSTAFAGGWSSTGGDNPGTLDESAWFLGTAPVKYCVQVAKGFGLSAEESVQAIEKAKQTWQAYIKEKHISLNGGDPLYVLDLNLSYQPHCGSEDLRFLLGVSTPDVELEKTKYSDPTAIAKRTQEPLNGWGKGWIWVTQPTPTGDKDHIWIPAWTQVALTGQILHELGHVIGCGHLDGTIMQRSLVSWIQGYLNPNFKAFSERFLSEIDSQRELYACFDCSFRSQGNMSEFPGDDASPDSLALFKRLTGRLANTSRIQAIFERSPNSNGSMEFALILDDGSNNPVRTKLNLIPGSVSQFSLGTPIFKAGRGFQDSMGSGVSAVSTDSEGRSMLFTMTSILGETFTVSFSWNSANSPASKELTILVDGKMKKLFFSDWTL